MATPKDELKSYFENGDIPGKDQFWAWLDSYRHSDSYRRKTQFIGIQMPLFPFAGTAGDFNKQDKPQWIIDDRLCKAVDNGYSFAKLDEKQGALIKNLKA